MLPPSTAPRLVIDIGGGSTEFIIGRGLTPERLESLKLGCVSDVAALLPRRRAARRGVRARRRRTRAPRSRRSRASSAASTGSEAYASSGTALALAAILEENGLSAGGITPEGLARLRKRMIGAGHIVAAARSRASSPSARRCCAGGFAIMAAAMAELDVPRINPVGGALRLGVLYDLLGRTVQRDSRAATVERFLERYHVDRAHAQRVAAMAKALYLEAAPRTRTRTSRSASNGPALLHEIGYTVSHIGFHKHGAYILENADMPGFSAQEQRQLALLVLGCRGGLVEDGARARRRRPRARRCWRCGSPCCSITRAARSTRRASRSTVGRAIRFGVAAALAQGASADAHLLVEGARRVGGAGPCAGAAAP